MPPKTVALIGAVCLTAGWLLASLLAPPVAKLQALPERRAPRAENTPDAPQAFQEQLQLRLRQAPTAPVPRRNPFVFGSRDRSSAPGEPAARDSSSDRGPEPAAGEAPQTTSPLFALSGIGVTETPQGEVFTAVLSDGNTVHLVKAGHTVGGYTVLEVTENSITLADAAGAQHVLRMR
jgi:hypothetical protein